MTSHAGLQFFRFGEGSGLNAGNVLCSQTRDLQQQVCATMCEADAAQVRSMLLIPVAAAIKEEEGGKEEEADEAQDGEGHDEGQPYDELVGLNRPPFCNCNQFTCECSPLDSRDDIFADS